jgi:Ran GTPase-activating protein (RanGAP) involved in mRNA processing and transport
MVAAAASLCDDLVEMRLQQCGITDEGAIELFTELKSLKKLKILDISFNAITERSLDHLQALLDSNKNLIVSMQMNGIKNKFAIRKMQAYEQAGRLKLSNS